jgi:HSP20 family protein
MAGEKGRAPAGRRIKTPVLISNIMNTITTWNPLRDLEQMQDRVLRSLGLNANRRLPDIEPSMSLAEWAPSVDIVEDDNEYLIKAEVPEVNKEDVKVTVENGMVTLRGERKLEKEEEHKKYHRIERSYGSFLRSFSIPENADPNKVSAEFKDGVLLVHLAKSEEKRPRCVEVTVN